MHAFSCVCAVSSSIGWVAAWWIQNSFSMNLLLYNQVSVNVPMKCAATREEKYKVHLFFLWNFQVKNIEFWVRSLITVRELPPSLSAFFPWMDVVFDSLYNALLLIHTHTVFVCQKLKDFLYWTQFWSTILKVPQNKCCKKWWRCVNAKACVRLEDFCA